jgi:hypothetical protein
MLLGSACSIHLSPGLGKSQRDVALFLSKYGGSQGEHFLRTGTFDSSAWRFPLMRSPTLRDLALAVKQDGYLCWSVTNPYEFSVTCSPQGGTRGLAYFLDEAGAIRVSANGQFDQDIGILTLNDDERENLRALVLCHSVRQVGSKNVR